MYRHLTKFMKKKNYTCKIYVHYKFEIYSTNE